MSTDYDIGCKTCGVSHGFQDANHAQDLMRSLIIHRDAIAALAPLMRDTDVELRPFASSYGRISISWFVEHAGHDLAVFDEYGREFGQCHQFYACAHCDARHWCGLPIGHDGPHGKIQ